MRAIVLAAGEGTRLRPLTADRPKCLVALRGRPLLDHQLAALAAAGVSDVTVVTGYRAEALAGRGLATRHNPAFAETNMVASLLCARDLLLGGEDVLVAYGDIVYEPRLVAAMRACEAPFATAVDRRWIELWRARQEDPLTDAETLRLGPDGAIRELGRRPQSLADVEGQYLGLIRLSAAFAPTFVAAWDALGERALLEGQPKPRAFMTAFLQHLIDAGHPCRAVLVEGGWLEVDTLEDLARYEALAARGELDRLWRAPEGA